MDEGSRGTVTSLGVAVPGRQPISAQLDDVLSGAGSRCWTLAIATRRLHADGSSAATTMQPAPDPTSSPCRPQNVSPGPWRCLRCSSGGRPACRQGAEDLHGAAAGQPRITGGGAEDRGSKVTELAFNCRLCWLPPRRVPREEGRQHHKHPGLHDASLGKPTR